MKIGLFGGSFNPIHKGHIKIAKLALENLKLDKIIFIPCQKNPFKKKMDYVDGKMRLEMIELVLEKNMEVSNLEISRQGLSYTIDTVKYFKNLYKDSELFLIIGSDNLQRLHKWKDIDEIAKLTKISVFKRTKDINKTIIKKYNGILINNQLQKESSTSFFKGDFDVVDEKVRKYIGYNKIYFEQILKNVLDEKRFLHSKNAQNFAIDLAKSIKFDVKKAAFSAFVHDIAKNLANQNKQMAREIIANQTGFKEIEDYKLHQELGYIILKYKFNIEDDICNSVRVHTSLSLNLSQLDKIVFIADKLCRGRKYPGIQQVRKLVLENFDEGFKKVVERTKKFNLEKNISFSKEQEEIYEKWSK
ncbi:MAG: nicotinate-nucleotide adenylyltransferase [Mycoplasmataceae bacterium]|nr:nicotinate-nucleotide adenylyltransferase [Mycoplasmataceae bacterium]